MSKSPVWIETLEGCSQRSLPEWLVYGVENNAGDRGSPQQGLERAVMDKRGCKDYKKVRSGSR